MNSNETNFKLIINNCNSEDAATYTAKIKNNLGEASTQTKAIVLSGPVFIKPLQAEYNLKEKEVAKFTAEISANPKAEVTWTKESQETTALTPSDKFKLEAQSNSVSLSIKDLQLQDSAIYVCTAKNKISEAVSRTKLNVTIPPKFIKTPETNTEVELGGDLVVSCLAHGFPIPEAKIIRVEDQKLLNTLDEGVFEIKSNIINETQIEYVLVLKSIAINTPSVYECKLANESGEIGFKFDFKLIKKPEFVQRPDEVISLIENKDLIINCKVTSAPDAVLTWFKEGVKLAPSKRIQTLDVKEDTKLNEKQKGYMLKILAATKEDAGNYEIVAANKLGEARCNTQVGVQFPPSIVKDLKPKERAIEEAPFTFEFAVKANPKPDVKWYFGDKEIEYNDNIVESSQDGIYKLSIQKLTTEMSGTYKAVAKNILNSVQSVLSSLEVDIKPKLSPLFQGLNQTQESCDLISDENSLIELILSLTGKPEPNVEYFKDDLKIKPSEKRLSLVKKDNTVKLSIPDLKVADAGVYKISAKNLVGEVNYLINLKIRSTPKLVKTLKSKIEYLENTKLELTCSSVPGVYPEPEFKWSKNDELIEDKDQPKFTILKDNTLSSLVIESVSLNDDLTKFKCICSNEVGSSESETSLEVISLPKFLVSIVDSEPQLNLPFDWCFEIDSHPEPKLKFIKNDKEFVIGKEPRVKLNKVLENRNDRKVWSCKLTFEKIFADDLGTYRIEAANKAGDAKCAGKLVVKGSPCFIRKPIDTCVNLNKPAKVECEISGIPIPSVQWLKNGEPLVENDRVKIENKLKTIYWLNIKNCVKEDIGVYTVRLQNEDGIAEESFNFSIQGRKFHFIF